MTYIRQARLGHARFKQKFRRSRRRLKGFQTFGLRSLGNSLVANRDNKRNELNEIALVVAIIVGLAAGFLGGSLFGTFGFLIAGGVAYFGSLDYLKENKFLRG